MWYNGTMAQRDNIPQNEQLAIGSKTYCLFKTSYGFRLQVQRVDLDGRPYWCDPSIDELKAAVRAVIIKGEPS